MRSIDEIKESIAVDFMKNETVAELFGFTAGDDFFAHFSKVSIISILFYIFACAAWVLENLFDAHKKEVNTRIEEIIPHRPKWYRDRVLNFMKDKTLIPDTDRYDTSDMTVEAIDAAHVIKHAVADENKEASILTIKVAGESGGKRCKLPENVEEQLAAYIAEIKDAGVRINLVNKDPDTFNCNIDIYYNAMLLPENVQKDCLAAIKSYIENLPFNGEYNNMALIDTLQMIDGVKLAELKQATTTASDSTTVTSIDARYVPTAGYFTSGEINLKMKAYEQV